MGVNSALFVLSFGISAWTGIAVTAYNFSTKTGASSCFKIFDLFSLFSFSSNVKASLTLPASRRKSVAIC